MNTTKKRSNCKCGICGRTFYKKPSAIKNGEGKFCSNVCRGKSQTLKNTVRVRCDRCGNTFLRWNSHLDGQSKNYCSMACRIKYLHTFSGKKQYNWWYKYKMMPDQILSIAENQHFGCAICKRDIPQDMNYWNSKNVHVDHNHETGIVRGILCRDCNLSLGRFQDSPDILRRAAEYLEGGVKN